MWLYEASSVCRLGWTASTATIRRTQIPTIIHLFVFNTVFCAFSLGPTFCCYRLFLGCSREERAAMKKKTYALGDGLWIDAKRDGWTIRQSIENYIGPRCPRSALVPYLRSQRGRYVISLMAFYIFSPRKWKMIRVRARLSKRLTSRTCVSVCP